jgi:hypothetical protein
MTPLGMRYEEGYAPAYPFDRVIKGLLQPEMVLEAREIVKSAIEKGVPVNLLINNRVGGNAPLITRKIAEKFLPKKSDPLQGKRLSGSF